MKNRPNYLALLCLAGLATGIAPAAAHAQYDTPAPAVELRTPPRWVAVPGTNVLVIRRDQRPAYDMFSVGSRYYIYDHDTWYRSDTWSGPFDAIDERAVPRAIRDVPEDEWQSYPSAWMASDNRRDDASGVPAPPRVVFRYAPTWVMVPGTSVRMIRRDERPAYDMFDYGSTYYLYRNGYWYEANTPTGPFQAIDEGDVPIAIQRVPESEWRQYPSGWSMNGSRRGYGNVSDREGRRYSDRESRRYDVSRAPAPPEVYFRTTPRWTRVAGTRVMVVRGPNRPRSDLFRVGGWYYLETDGYWYRSNQVNGPYAAIDSRGVPLEIANVPRGYWRSYPEDWAMSARYRSRRPYQR